MQSSNKLSTNCYHCGENCNNNKIRLEDKVFCCDGCKLVYEILNENNLCTYYDLNDNPGLTQKIKVRENKFSFLDDIQIQQKLLQFTDGKQTHLTFYLPQMHCSSCLWLIENLHKINKGVVASTVNFTKKEVFIIYQNDLTTLRKVVESLTAIGYEPHISLQDVEEQKIQFSEKSKLYKLGVAGFCFANIMMMSVPEYLVSDSILEKDIRSVLTTLIIVFSLPVFFYCASEFFVAAWKGIKNKYLNIDVPVALAILITFLRSFYEVFYGNGAGYFDSMSGIVFFMLIGRYLQDKTYQSISFDRDYKSFFPVAVNVIKENKAVPTPIENVKVGDTIQIYNNELIPVDAILSKGKAAINYSFVSGESMPVHVNIGEIIYAGGKQMDGAIELLVVKEVSQSYLTNLWNKDIFKHKEKKTNSFIHVLSKYFTLIVLGIAALAASYWFIQKEYTLMWNTITTVLIVACPCTLLLAATYTNGFVMNVFNQNKFYLRHADVIENISKIKHIVFDKTGTLTQNDSMIVQYHGNVLSLDDKQAIVAILKQSAHPLSKAIIAFLKIEDEFSIENFKETLGKGMEAWIHEKYYKIGSEEFVLNTKTSGKENSSIVFLKVDNQLLGNFTIQNQYRFGFNALIQSLKSKFTMSVLSGDNSAEKENLQQLLGQESEILFHQKPEDKLKYIQHLQDTKHLNVMMVGDGLNDAGALKQSNVGITITENSNNFSPACDAILDATQFSNIDKFIALSCKAQKVIIISFVVSFIYNVIGLYFAVQGILSPFIAAILMPCSSVSIILLTFSLIKLETARLKLSKPDKNHIM